MAPRMTIGALPAAAKRWRKSLPQAVRLEATMAGMYRALRSKAWPCLDIRGFGVHAAPRQVLPGIQAGEGSGLARMMEARGFPRNTPAAPGTVWSPTPGMLSSNAACFFSPGSSSILLRMAASISAMACSRYARWVAIPGRTFSRATSRRFALLGPHRIQGLPPDHQRPQFTQRRARRLPGWRLLGHAKGGDQAGVGRVGLGAHARGHPKGFDLGWV